MNKRQKKKLAKRDWCRSYAMYRYEKIAQNARWLSMQISVMRGLFITDIEIVDSKKGKYKHPLYLKIYAMKDSMGFIDGPRLCFRYKCRNK